MIDFPNLKTPWSLKGLKCRESLQTGVRLNFGKTKETCWVLHQTYFHQSSQILHDLFPNWCCFQVYPWIQFCALPGGYGKLLAVVRVHHWPTHLPVIYTHWPKTWSICFLHKTTFANPRHNKKGAAKWRKWDCDTHYFRRHLTNAICNLYWLLWSKKHTALGFLWPTTNRRMPIYLLVDWVSS